MLLASAFIPLGLEYAAAMAVIGIVIGELLSFIYVAAAYKLRKPGPKPPKTHEKSLMTKKQALLAITAMAAPLTLTRIMSSFLSTVETVLIPQRLQAYGMAPEEAMGTFGKITGMAMPLIFFPSAILVALSISLVPSIAESIALGHKERVNLTISKSIVFTSIVAFGAGLIFVVFTGEIGQIVYNQDLGNLLLILGLMCPFWYLNITLNGLLNGLGEQSFIFRNSLLASVINIAFVYFFVPFHGVTAFLAGWFISLLIVTFFDILRLKKVAAMRPQILKWFIKPALAATAAGLAIKLIHNNIALKILPTIPAVLISLALLMAAYLTAVILLRIISIKDIKQLIDFRR
jgi:stage V sporulation protein B